MKTCAMMMLAGIMIAFCRPNHAATLYVSPTGTNNIAGKYPDWAGAATNIQAAITEAVNDDEIRVTNAEYRVSAAILVDRRVLLRSWNNGALDRTNTVINGQGLTSCLYLNFTAARVAGFCFTNGNGLGGGNNDYGGGVYVSAGIVSNCVISGNSANLRGGGIYIVSSSSSVLDSDIAGNTVTNGMGGGAAAVTASKIRNCKVRNNHAVTTANYSGGGGIYLQDQAEAVGCDIFSNVSDVAGGGVFINFHGTLTSNTIYGNQALGSASYNGGGGVCDYLPSAGINNIRACVLSNNIAGRAAGGGIQVRLANTAGYGVTIEDCCFRNNTSKNYGGGLDVSGAWQANTVRVTRCVFEGNAATNSDALGGGVSLDGAGIMSNCVVVGNTAAYRGGGIAFTRLNVGSEIPVVRNSLIASNTATANYGGGIFLNTTSIVENCTIVSNSAGSNGGGLYCVNAGGQVRNSVIYFNTAASGGNNCGFYSASGYVFDFNCMTPTNDLRSIPFAGVTTNDPLLADRAAGNYRLNTQSPCINTGSNQYWTTNAVDLDGRTRIRYGTVDMGAYEYIYRGSVFSAR